MELRVRRLQVRPVVHVEVQDLGTDRELVGIGGAVLVHVVHHLDDAAGLRDAPVHVALAVLGVRREEHLAAQRHVRVEGDVRGVERRGEVVHRVGVRFRGHQQLVVGAAHGHQRPETDRRTVGRSRRRDRAHRDVVCDSDLHAVGRVDVAAAAGNDDPRVQVDRVAFLVRPDAVLVDLVERAALGTRRRHGVGGIGRQHRAGEPAAGLERRPGHVAVPVPLAVAVRVRGPERTVQVRAREPPVGSEVHLEEARGGARPARRPDRLQHEGLHARLDDVAAHVRVVRDLVERGIHDVERGLVQLVLVAHGVGARRGGLTVPAEEELRTGGHGVARDPVADRGAVGDLVGAHLRQDSAAGVEVHGADRLGTVEDRQRREPVVGAEEHARGRGVLPALVVHGEHVERVHAVGHVDRRRERERAVRAGREVVVGALRSRQRGHGKTGARRSRERLGHGPVVAHHGAVPIGPGPVDVEAHGNQAGLPGGDDRSACVLDRDGVLRCRRDPRFRSLVAVRLWLERLAASPHHQPQQQA